MVRLYRSDEPETTGRQGTMLKERFPDGKYADVAGLCKVATLTEIEAQGWSLNPGRNTGTAAVDDYSEDFNEELSVLFEEFNRLSAEAEVLRAKVDSAISQILAQ